jgi:Zn-dependent protease/CBS domain-containing protein
MASYKYSPKYGTTRLLSAPMPISGRSWRVAEMAGIEVRLHISLALLALLITFTLATGVILNAMPPSAEMRHAPPLYWFYGLVGAGLAIFSVFWHEMAHCLAAQYYRLPVLRITLHLFGGLAHIGRDPERPQQEFIVAIAGPASSLLLAVIFALAAGTGNIAGVVLAWLATFNLMLVLFNLLPAFPLDGGRVLRAIFWRLSDSYWQATVSAARVGRAFAIAFGVGGFLVWVLNPGANLFFALWMAAIAWMLYSGANGTLRATRSKPMAKETPVSRVTRRNVPVLTGDMYLAIFAWKYFDHAHDQAFPVMQGDDLIGMMTAAEMTRIPRLEWGTHKVSEVMLLRERLCLVRAEEDLQTVMAALDKAGLDHAPVYQAGNFIGMLNRRDIVYRT